MADGCDGDASSEIYLTRGELRSPIEAAGCAVARGA